MAQTPRVPPPPVKPPVGKVAGSTGSSSFKNVLRQIHQEITRNKTTMYMAIGYAVIMLFLVSGIFVMSVNNKKAPPAPPNLTLPSYEQVLPTPTTTPKASLEGHLSATATPTPNSTTDWDTFTNAGYGYSIKHPKEWKATEVGSTDPKVPSFVVLNPDNVASPASSLDITISTSTRPYSEVIALKSSTRSAITVSGLTGIKTTERNSDGNESIHVVLSGTKYVYILVAKKKYEGVFNQIYPTFTPI